MMFVLSFVPKKTERNLKVKLLIIFAHRMTKTGEKVMSLDNLSCLKELEALFSCALRSELVREKHF